MSCQVGCVPARVKSHPCQGARVLWRVRLALCGDKLALTRLELLIRVAHALYQRATGYTDPAGKYYPPVTTACIFWLKNRQPGQWRDKYEQETTMKTDRLDELVNSIRNGEAERR